MVQRTETMSFLFEVMLFALCIIASLREDNLVKTPRRKAGENIDHKI